ncbi:MAG: hypothetical protein J0I14_05745 [Propionibacteriaceae bacterium]|nr:hypothetical protein [Propionibacteriaceae bacterium]
MNNPQAIAALMALKEQAETDPQVQTPTPQHKAWKAKAVSVLEHSLGTSTHITQTFRGLQYFPPALPRITGMPSSDDSRRAKYFQRGILDAAALLGAAIYELELDLSPEPDSRNFDQGLWDHVKHSVDEERWDQVASAAAIYLEDKVRRWSGTPTGKDGGKLVGKELFLKVLAADGPLPLGAQPNETDGWRMLGSGLVAAVGNVDRHNIQDRDDLRRYAMGVVGLTSLLLTQIRHQHPDLASGR